MSTVFQETTFENHDMEKYIDPQNKFNVDASENPLENIILHDNLIQKFMKGKSFDEKQKKQLNSIAKALLSGSFIEAVKVVLHGHQFTVYPDVLNIAPKFARLLLNEQKQMMYNYYNNQTNVGTTVTSEEKKQMDKIRAQIKNKKHILNIKYYGTKFPVVIDLKKFIHPFHSIIQPNDSTIYWKISEDDARRVCCSMFYGFTLSGHPQSEFALWLLIYISKQNHHYCDTSLIIPNNNKCMQLSYADGFSITNVPCAIINQFQELKIPQLHFEFVYALILLMRQTEKQDRYNHTNVLQDLENEYGEMYNYIFFLNGHMWVELFFNLMVYCETKQNIIHKEYYMDTHAKYKYSMRNIFINMIQYLKNIRLLKPQLTKFSALEIELLNVINFYDFNKPSVQLKNKVTELFTRYGVIELHQNKYSIGNELTSWDLYANYNIDYTKQSFVENSSVSEIAKLNQQFDQLTIKKNSNMNFSKVAHHVFLCEPLKFKNYIMKIGKMPHVCFQYSLPLIQYEKAFTINSIFNVMEIENTVSDEVDIHHSQLKNYVDNMSEYGLETESKGMTIDLMQLVYDKDNYEMIQSYNKAILSNSDQKILKVHKKILPHANLSFMYGDTLKDGDMYQLNDDMSLFDYLSDHFTSSDILKLYQSIMAGVPIFDYPEHLLIFVWILQYDKKYKVKNIEKHIDITVGNWIDQLSSFAHYKDTLPYMNFEKLDYFFLLISAYEMRDTIYHEPIKNVLVFFARNETNELHEATQDFYNYVSRKTQSSTNDLAKYINTILKQINQ